MQWAVLPIGGKQHLCTVGHGHVETIVEAPGSADALYVMSSDATHLAVLDNGRKRAGLFELLPREPWIRRSIPFGTLPRKCLGHASISVAGTLYVGGHGSAGEALWRSSAAGNGTWMAIALPDELRVRGKAIDGLHFHNHRLLAVDDLRVPKWLLEFGLAADGELALERQIRLPTHTTYERIIHSCLGANGLGIISRGNNHGIASTHVWMLDDAEFRQTACWDARQPGMQVSDWQFSGDEHPPSDEVSGSLRPASARESLRFASEAAQLSGHLILVCRKQGALAVDLSRHHPTDSDAALQRLNVPGLVSCDSIVEPMPADGSGVFLVGRDAADVPAIHWLPACDLENTRA